MRGRLEHFTFKSAIRLVHFPTPSSLVVLVLADFAHQCVKCIVHAHARLGGCLNVWNAVLFGHLESEIMIGLMNH